MRQLPRFVSTTGLAVIALLPLMAHAQSNVTISGTVDVGMYRSFDKTTHVGPISRSDLTFKGSEDLGSGLATTFRLSTRFDTDTGSVECCNKPFWYGESTVGLKGSFGHIRLGRAMEAVTANDWAFDPWGNFDRIASPAWHFWHYNYTADGTANAGSPEYFRLSNGIFYDSPTFGGVSISLSGSPEKPTGTGAGTKRSYQGALKYAQGPAAATLAFGKNASNDEVLFLGAKYAFGSLTLMGAYDRSKFEAATPAVAYARTIGATYQLGSFLFQGSYGRLNASGAKTSFIGLGSQYALSKRTYVYVSFGHKRPGSADSASSYGIGINHSF